MPSICIVIVNFNSYLLTCRCIASIKQYVTTEVSIIVVDNSCTSEIPDILGMHPEVIAIQAEKNLGFAGGCNLGIQYALDHKISYIQLLNPDTRVEQDFIDPLVKVLEEDNSLAVAAPKILRDTPERDVWYGGGGMNWWFGGPVQKFDHSNDSRGDVQVTPVLSGCAMMLKTAAVEKVGVMAEDYFLYYEDTDYVQRFLQAGFQAAYVPEVEIVHDASTTVGFQSPEYIYYFSRNRIWFMRRWAKWYHLVVFMLYNTFVKLPGSILVFGVVRRNPALVGAYFRGYWHGITDFMLE